MKMNQNEIDKLLDDMITEEAKKIDAVFAQRLKEINQQMAALLLSMGKMVLFLWLISTNTTASKRNGADDRRIKQSI